MIGPGEDSRTLQFGQRLIDYQLFWLNRKTLEIAVHPDGQVTVKAPYKADISQVEAKIKKRARWIFKQIKYFRQFDPKTPERFYINGETHLYLGRQYRLKIEHGEQDSVKLSRGYFNISCLSEATPENVKRLMNRWYLDKAANKFNEAMLKCWPKLKLYGLPQPSLSIRKMRKRWGSLSDNGVVRLNIELIKAPVDCIEYVVTHELCHLKYSDHSSSFYQMLSKVFPGWEKIKHKLEISLA